TAYAALEFDAKQFGNIPTRSYDLYLLKVKVPMNYDPETREYATSGPGTTGGVWDGTFKVAWTDNPAWAFYDLATTERYGLGNYVSASQIDKFALYTIAQYCDELIPNGYSGTGQMEPRFTCNCFIQTREQAMRVMANLASVFRGMLYWAN